MSDRERRHLIETGVALIAMAGRLPGAPVAGPR